MEYQTNIFVDKHNTWTLTKHLVQSANKAAAKIDAKVYGTKTNVVIVPMAEPIVEKSHGVKDFFIGFGCLIVLAICVAGLASGKMKWYQMLP